MTMDAPRSTTPPVSGAITAFTLADGGNGWLAGDTAFAIGGNNDSIFDITSVSQSGGGTVAYAGTSVPAAITAIDQSGKVITIQDQTAFGENMAPKLIVGATLGVQLSTANDGAYTISAIVPDSGTHTIALTVLEAIPSPIADGNAGTAGVIFIDTGAGDLSSLFASGQYFYIGGSTGNDGTREINVSDYDGTNTRVIPTFDNTIGNGTADGTIDITGAIVGITLATGGTGYSIANAVVLSNVLHADVVTTTINITAVS